MECVQRDFPWEKKPLTNQLAHLIIIIAQLSAIISNIRKYNETNCSKRKMEARIFRELEWALGSGSLGLTFWQVM